MFFIDHLFRIGEVSALRNSHIKFTAISYVVDGVLISVLLSSSKPLIADLSDRDAAKEAIRYQIFQKDTAMDKVPKLPKKVSSFIFDFMLDILESHIFPKWPDYAHQEYDEYVREVTALLVPLQALSLQLGKDIMDKEILKISKKPYKEIKSGFTSIK